MNDSQNAPDRDEYARCLEYLFSLGRFGIKLGTETISAMLAGLGDPQDRFPSIHLAGTNGKGSVAAMLAAVLSRSGYKVGVYTSPHLVHINERFCVDGRPVSDGQVLEAFRAVHNAPRPEREATYFEYTTAMAFHIFARTKVDWAVVETGMGGRLDATNVISPRLSVITNISLEHQQYLGRTLAAVATEKAGIIKPGVPVVTGARQEAALSSIRKAAVERQAPLYVYGKNFSVRRKGDGTFAFSGLGERLSRLTTRLCGPHQADNAALVLAGVRLLQEQGVSIPDEALVRGVAEARWPGRLDVVGENPRIVLDGAHNLAAMKVLIRAFGQAFPGERPTVIAGFLDDKPWPQMLSMLSAMAGRLILTQPAINRAVPAARLFAALPADAPPASTADSVARALDLALDQTPASGAILAAGSLYVVGEMMQALEKAGRMTGEFRIG